MAKYKPTTKNTDTILLKVETKNRFYAIRRKLEKLGNKPSMDAVACYLLIRDAELTQLLATQEG